MKEVRGANLVFKAIDVLDAIADADAPLRLTQLAQATGMPAPTLTRILDALISRRLVRKDEASRSYRLGPKLLQLARHSWDEFDVRGAAEPELERLHGQYGQTIALCVMIDGTAVVIDKREGQQALRTSLAVGQRVPLHCSAMGKAMLASLPPAEQIKSLAQLELEPFTATTMVDRTTLQAHLAMMAARRYAIEDEEQAEGVRAVAAAILNQRGAPIGAIGFSGARQDLSLDRLFEVGAELAEAAQRVSWNLGFMPPEPWPGFTFAPGADAITCAIPAAAFLGSSPVWNAEEGGLDWIDIHKPAIHRSRPADGLDRTLPLPTVAGSIVPAGRRLLATLSSGIALIDPTDGTLEPVARIIPKGGHQRYNSAKCDALGRLWVTTMDVTISRANGGLYRVDADGSIHRMVDGLLVPIGLAWSPDNRRMYFCDAPRREIYECAFDVATGEIADRRVLIRVGEGSGRPTGLAVDRAGFLWSLQTDGWCVTRYDPQGGIDRVVSLPVPKPIDCCFGGHDMRTLFITTSRLGLSERRIAEVPWSGSILSYDCPEPGLPVYMFGQVAS